MLADDASSGCIQITNPTSFGNPSLVPVKPLADDAPLQTPSSPEIKIVADRSLVEAIISNRKPIVIEFCAGTAGFSAEIFKCKFQSLAVDCSRNRFKVKHAITTLDLLEEGSVVILFQLLESGLVFLVFAGVPCGTASRAREIPIKGNLKRVLKGKPPQPFRSETFPFGLASIVGLDLHKLLTANLVYINVGRIMAKCRELGIFRAVENPKNS